MKHDIIFHAGIVFLSLIAGYRWIWKPWSIDRFRAFVSEGRDALFDYWQVHRLPADNYAYGR